MRVLTIIERGGKARSVVGESLKFKDVNDFLKKNASSASELNTDEAAHYLKSGERFLTHRTVNHGKKEYARWEKGDLVTINSAEGFYSIFKRGMVGVYQHCGRQHLHRYVAEFDFRHSNRLKLGIDDAMRTTKALQGASGKRLTYRRTGSVQAA